MTKENVMEMFDDLLMQALEAPRGFDIVQECVSIARMLVDKNIQYGNSALEPLRYHSSASPLEQIRVRMDDKLSRMSRGQSAGEDPALDYVGYYILLRIATRDAEAAQQTTATRVKTWLNEGFDPDEIKELAEERALEEQVEREMNDSDLAEELVDPFAGLEGQHTEDAANDEITWSDVVAADYAQDLLASWFRQNPAEAERIIEAVEAVERDEERAIEEQIAREMHANPFKGMDERNARGNLFADKSTFDKLLKGDRKPSVSEIPPPPPGWASQYGPVCQNDGCENHTGNSDRVVCPPCLKRNGMGQALDNGTAPMERSSEGVLPRK